MHSDVVTQLWRSILEKGFDLSILNFRWMIIDTDNNRSAFPIHSVWLATLGKSLTTFLKNVPKINKCAHFDNNFLIILRK